MQQVLTSPHTSAGTIFYKRKLSIYNLSVYSLGTSVGCCYMWAEIEAQRGSAEVGTAMLKYISSLPKTVRTVILYSDCCGGQNKNRNLATALIYTMLSNPHIIMIEHKYLESGHTHMEVDSIHAAIERAKKSVPVYVPHDWYTVVRCARRKHPYSVIPMTHDDICDFSQMSDSVPHLSKIRWRNVKWLRYL